MQKEGGVCHGAAGFGSSSFHTPETRAPVSSLLPPWASAIVLPGKRSYFFSLKAKQLPAASPSAARAPGGRARGNGLSASESHLPPLAASSRPGQTACVNIPSGLHVMLNPGLYRLFIPNFSLDVQTPGNITKVTQRPACSPHSAVCTCA